MRVETLQVNRGHDTDLNSKLNFGLSEFSFSLCFSFNSIMVSFICMTLSLGRQSHVYDLPPADQLGPMNPPYKTSSPR